MRINRLLIANRGEIAVRIIKTAKAMGLHCVTMHSEADKNALFVKLSDESFFLPNGYLDIQTIINKSKELQVDAIHPGYGFLSENSDFCKKVKDSKIIWIGPDPETIDLMGDKINSKELCIKEGIPTLLKSTEPKDAKKIGFPILVKASAGGGGKGMRIVETQSQLKDAIAAAKREASSSFGDDRVFLEKFISKSRHIEVQILADNFGNVIHLGERECSIQRRHQKIIEESPSSRLTEKIRSEITSTAANLAKKINYKSAGTVEFLFDEETNEFWFLEVNTRLQVEHPITEAVTGIDLVKEQIKIAEGKKLSLKQDDIRHSGHAIEARIYAENPNNNFLPEIGKLEKMQYPLNEGIRWDNGVESGDVVTPNYDPMLAKVIAHAETREQASKLLAKELKSTHIAGLITNKEFLVNCLENKSFLGGKTTSDFIERESKKIFLDIDKGLVDKSMKAAVLWLQQINKLDNERLNFLPRNWTNGIMPKENISFTYQEEEYIFSYENISEDIVIHRKYFERISESKAKLLDHNQAGIRVELDEIILSAQITKQNDLITVNLGKGDVCFKINPRFADPNEVSIEGGLVAPMPGKILKIMNKKGAKVKAGDTLIILEAMKMEHTIKASDQGIISDLFVKVGDQVENGSLLMKID
tara:strand:- start:9178 stop:11115 length:1938 start_codon:yes stop_codon:yes gene_type:complete